MTSRYIKQSGNLFTSFCCLLLISACSSTDSTPGTEVHAHLTHLPPASTVTATTTPGKQFDNDQGVTVELTSAFLTISEMELRTDCSASPFALIFDTVYELLVPTATAHTESTPTRLGEPLVVNLLNPDSEELEFGHFSPAAGSYCGITVHMHPADVDARGVVPEIANRVIHIVGLYDDNVNNAGTFTLNIDIEPEHADILLPSAIELSSSNLSGEAHLNIEYNSWFNGLDATGIASLEAGDLTAVQQFLENVTHSIHSEH